MKQVARTARLVLLAATLQGIGACAGELAVDADWPVVGGDPEHRRYSTLEQINSGNVQQLELAWSFRTGGADLSYSKMHCEPLAIDGVLYLASPILELIAVDGATGVEKWRFSPYAEGEQPRIGLNRGVATWADNNERRIFYGVGSYLYAVDAATGNGIESFGEGGRVDLRKGLGRDYRSLSISAPAPGTVFEDLIIMGSSVGESVGAAPGHIRAFDVRTGEMRWIFHTIPQPGEAGYDSWPAESWKTVGGANAWGGISLDPEAGVVFAPTGSATYDFYGGDRAGDNLYANSLLALDARNGERRWHYQIVHHDLWDRDLPAPPSLGSVTVDGQDTPIAAQVTKHGSLFVFDRDTGKPVFPVEEQVVPAGDIPGEWYAATQPVPLSPPPFTRQHISAGDLGHFSENMRKEALARFRALRSEGPFTPPSLEGSLLAPGFNGGAEWGGATFDPETGMLYVNANEVPNALRLVEIRDSMGDAGREIYLQNCATCHGVNREGGMEETPALTDIAQKYSSSSEQTVELIMLGRGRMPGFAHLSFAEILVLIDYLFDDGGEPSGEPVEAAMAPEGEGPRNYVVAGYNPLATSDGAPVIAPPWGTLTAYDLKKGDIAWQVPLGEYATLAAKGMKNTGAENRGGSVVTAGGLLFIAATPDEKIRAFDKRTGALLWEADLPASGFASTITYMIGGRQFVVVAAGGGKMGRPPGDYYVAFALPESE